MDAERRKSTGATIRTLREARGQTRQQLADLAGISVQMLAKIEQGHKAPSATSLAAIAHGLGLETPELALRSSAWEEMAAAGTRLATLRAGTISGRWANAGFAAAAAGAAGAIAYKERRNRRVLEAVLRSDLDLTPADLHEVAQQLGVELGSAVPGSVSPKLAETTVNEPTGRERGARVEDQESDGAPDTPLPAPTRD